MPQHDTIKRAYVEKVKELIESEEQGDEE